MAKKVILYEKGVQILPATAIEQVSGKASNGDMDTATDDTLYTTPLGVKRSIDTHAMSAITPHIENYNNPHKVTAEQTGAYWYGNSNKSDVEWKASNVYARQVLGHSAPTDSIGTWLDIRGTNGNGANKAGGGLALYAGKGTGTAVGGDIQFISSHAGSVSGSSVNPTVINAVIKSNGFMGIGTATPSEKLDVNGNILATNMFIGNSTTKNQVWHAGNSNKADVNWNCDNLYLNYSIRNKGDGTSTFDTHLFSFSPSTRKVTLGSTLTGTGKDVKSIEFQTGGDIRAIILENGNIGVNNTTPIEKLDVNGNIKSANIYTTNVVHNANYHLNGLYGSITTRHKGSSYWDGGLVVYGDTATTEHTNKFGVFTHYKGALRIGTQWRGVEGLTSVHTPIEISPSIGENSIYIKTNGYVGFGTNNPTEKIAVNGNIKGNNHLILTDTMGSKRIVFGNQDSGGVNKPSIIEAVNGAIRFGNGNSWSDSSGGVINVAFTLNADSSATFKSNVTAGGNITAKGDVVAKSTNAVVFSTSDAAAGATRLNDLIDVKLPTNLANKMVLAYDPAQVNSDGSKGGYTFMPSAGTGTGKVSSTEIASLPDHNHNDIVYASDERLKENVIPLRNATIMLNNLRPKEYNWNETGIKLGLRDPKAYGLIAQEVEGLREIIDLVKPMHGGESGYLGVDYVKLVPVLIAGFQEQHKEIIALNQKLKTIQARANKAYGNETNNADKIAQLEADNSAMRAEIEELKMLIKK